MIEYEKLLSVGGLSLERLATLCLVDEAGGLSKAAGGDISRLSLYSRQLKDLERFFGAPITRRVGRTVVLTEAGRELAAQVRGHFKDLVAFRDAAGVSHPVYRLGASHSLLEWWLWPRMMDASSVFPGEMRIEAVVGRTAELVSAVEAHTLDAALVRSDAVPRGLLSRPVFSFGYALFLPTSLLPSKRRVGPKEFMRLPLAVATGGQFKRALFSACARAGIEPLVRLECPSNTLAARAVALGRYAAVLPDLAASAFEGGTVRRVALPFLELADRDVALVWHPQLAEARVKAIFAFLGLRGR